MPYYTPEDILKAKRIDLLSYLQNDNPHELVHISTNVYCTKEHDSLKISNGKWYWWSRGFGGRSALDYLIKVKEYTFIEAMGMLGGQAVMYSPAPAPSPKKSTPKKLLLPNKNSNTSRVKSYLIDRGISPMLIDLCVRKDLIFESLPNHNAVFIGFDKENNPRYASYRSTNQTRILGDVEGSDKRYSFRLVSDCATAISVHLFESAIDLLSYATILELTGRDYKKEHLLSLAGVYQPSRDVSQSKIPIALEQFLKDHLDVKRIVFHLDTDKIGCLATQAISRALPDCYEKINQPPSIGKDCNNYLCIYLRSKNNKKEERNLAR